MRKCQAPGCRDVAVTEWDGALLCDEHYYEFRNKYKSEWDEVLERRHGA